MQSKTANDKKHKGQSERGESPGLTCDDRIGMFEAGLEELMKCYDFDVVNVAGGVHLRIVGLKRVDHDNGMWHLDPIEPVQP